MADERIEVILDIKNISDLDKVEQKVNSLNGRRIRIDIDSHSAEASAQRVVRACNMINNAIAGIGKASQLTASFASGIGDAFSAMSKAFDFNLISNIERALTSLATGAVVGNMDAVVQRTDIMKTFSDYMELAGASSEQAAAALDKVDQSIRGLPIGLDEAAQRLRRYQMFIGDLDRATNITIGVQKAITAGGANESAKNMAYYQLDRLLTAGELATTRQWYSLINGLGVSMKFLVQAMGVGNISVNELAAGLTNGTYSAEQLLDAFARLGEGTGQAAQDLDRALGIYKTTLESWLSNIRFAAIRGMTNVGNAVNSVLEDLTGTPITGYLEKIRDTMNTTFSSISSWITGNPIEASHFINSVRYLFDSLKGFDAGGLATGVLTNLGKTFTLFGDVIREVSGGDVESFIAFATTIAGPLGKLFKSVSSGLPIVLGVFERFRTFDFGQLVDDIVRHGTALTNVVTGFLNMFSDAGMSNLIAFGLVWGLPLAKAITAVASSVKLFTGKTIGEGLAKLFVYLSDSAPGLMSAAGAITAVAAAFGALYAVSKAVDNSQTAKIRKMYGLDEIREQMRGAETLVDTMRNTREEYSQTVAEIEEAYNRAEELRQKIMVLNGLDLSPEGHAELAEAVAELNAIYPALNAQIDSSTGFLDANTAAALANSDALKQLKDSAMAAASEQAMANTYAELFSARARRNALADSRRSVASIITGLTARRNAARRRAQGSSDGRSYDRDAYNDINDYSRRLRTVQGDYDDLTESITELDKEIALSESTIEYMKDEYSSAKKSMDDFAAGQEEVTQSAQSETEAIEQVAAAYDELKKSAQEALSEQLWGWQALEEQKPVTLDDLLSYIEQRNKLAEQMSKGTEKIREYALSSGNEELLGYLAELSGDGIKAAPAIVAMAEAIENQDYEKINAIAEAWGLFAQNYTAASNAVDNAVASPEDQMQEYANRDRPFSGYFGVFGASEASGAGTASQEAVGVVQGVIDGVVNAFENGKRLIEESAREAGEGTEALPSAILDGTRAAVGAGETLIHSATQGIFNVTPTLIEAARSAGVRAAAALQAALSGINITVNPTINTGTRNFTFNPHGNPMYEATGGMVYAANGQLIGFTPRGTDTVPAMLTPGEFVVRRGAVNSVGLQFLRSINNLDLHAAYDALVNRMQVPGMGGYITNNRDDHSSRTVNQYITNGGQHYSQRIASRWLHGI